MLGDAPAQRDAEARRLRASLDRALFDSKAEAALDRYRLGDVLGRGGVGVVYRAFDPLLQRDVALKVLRIDGGSEDTRPKERWLREARAMAALAHPDIVPIYDVGSVDDEVYIAMELVVGGTLRSWLGTVRTLEAIVAAFIAAGRGLAAAHEAGLVHRDFKPDNVMVGPGDRMRVTDFGLVRVAAATVSQEHDDAEPADVPGSITRGTVGTPGYIAPEQRRGDAVDRRAGFGVADDGALYCLEPCTSPWINGCAGGQVCDEVTGRCFCSADAECGEGSVCDPI